MACASVLLFEEPTGTRTSERIAAAKAKIGEKLALTIATQRTEKPRFRGFSSSGGGI
jgi:hypothetical protein